MKIYFFCGVIVLKLVEGKDNYQIDKIYFPDKIGVNGKDLMNMLNYYTRQKEMVTNLTNTNIEYFVDIFRNEEDLIEILLENGYSKSFAIDMVRKGYRTLAKLTKYGI